MLCCLNNVSDVPLLIDYTSGRTEILQPGEASFYYDDTEEATKETWDFVEWGWLVDQDIEEDQEVREQWERLLALCPNTHNWALEGF